MLALRTAGCLDQWEQAWQQACNQRLLQRPERRLLRQQTRRDAAMSKLRQLILRLLLLRCPRLPVLTPIRLLPSLLLAPLFPLLPADQLLTILGAVASSQKNDAHPHQRLATVSPVLAPWHIRSWKTMDVVNGCAKEPAHGGDPACSPRLRRDPAAGGPIMT